MQRYHRKLKGTIRIVCVWEASSAERNAIVFEEEGGDLWQFCDVGLGWSSFKELKADWTVKSDIQAYFPATLRPRPRINGPWDFEIVLDSGAKLEVRPGKRKGTYLLSTAGKTNT